MKEASAPAVSIPVATLAVNRKSGPEYVDYSCQNGDEIAIGIRGRGFFIRLREDGSLELRGHTFADNHQVVAYFHSPDCVVLSVRGLGE